MMLGQRKPFDQNDPQYMGQVDTGANPAMPAAPNPIAPPPTFAPPKEGHNWVGILADALAGLSGNAPIYAPMMERRRQEQTAFDRGEQQWQKHHQVDVADQIRLLDYKNAHPDDELTQYMRAAGIDPTSDAGRALYTQKTQAMVAPPMMSAQGVDEQGNPVMRFFPRAQPVAPGAPQPGMVKNGYRFKGGDPGSPSSWEPVGGPTQPASGGFR
jgi:hypothetical protein